MSEGTAHSRPLRALNTVAHEALDSIMALAEIYPEVSDACNNDARESARHILSMLDQGVNQFRRTVFAHEIEKRRADKLREPESLDETSL